MNTFTKEERLCSKKLIGELLQNGSSFLLYPFRIVWKVAHLPENTISPAQILISVSKKRFKRANKRNRIKRLIRETYRLNKQTQLYRKLQDSHIQITFMCSYIGNDILPYAELEKKLKLTLVRLSNEAVKSIPAE